MSNERNVGVSDVERQYPPEYFIAQVAFATTLAALAGVPIFDALFRYTALYRELVGKPPVPGVSEPLWVAFGVRGVLGFGTAVRGAPLEAVGSSAW